MLSTADIWNLWKKQDRDVWKFYYVVRLLALAEARDKVAPGVCTCNSCSRAATELDQLLTQEDL